MQDRFLWNVNEKDVSPEQYALQFCTDMQLGGDFVVAVAHAIQLQVTTLSYLILS